LSGTNHRIDGERLWDSLMRMAEIGATPRGGVRRLALSAEDARAASASGMVRSPRPSVRVDAMGNMFARREGRDPRRAPVLFGSHLDSQPSGGKFDGALGVLAGLEVMRSLRDLDIATEAPLELVNWTDEEGSRFGRSLMGSGVWAGVYPEGEILAARDTEASRSARRWTASARAARTPRRPSPADAYFELHIEQGPSSSGKEDDRRRHRRPGAGVVGRARFGAGQPRRHHPALRPARRAGVRGPRRGLGGPHDARPRRGRPRHGGLPPGAAQQPQRGARRGALQRRVPPPRHGRDGAARRGVPARGRRHRPGLRRRLELAELFRFPHQPFDAACVALVRQAAARLGLPARDIVSGAGHDAVYVARRVPTAMIFVPCKDGLSHNEAESILPEEAEAGCQVLFEAVLARANRPAA
jgi:N-carbamoyl-L-amino-acid hydrolase